MSPLNERPLSVVVLAAGQGTRMKSSLPKVLHTIAGRPLVEHVIQAARQLQASDIHVVYGHGGEQVQQALSGYDLSWAEQAEQLGTGHAVEQALPGIADDHLVLLLYGDVPLISVASLRQLLAAGVTSDGADALALLTARLDDPTGYGRIVRDAGGAVQAIVEQKDANEQQLAITEINTGMLAVNAALLKRWIDRLDNNNAQGEFYLTDIVGLAVADHVSVNTTNPAEICEIEGVNNKRQLAELERAYQLRQARRLMEDGLTLRDPARFDLRGELMIGRDVEIDINVVIEGRVELGDGVVIGPNVVLKNVTIGSATQVYANSVLEDSRLGSHCDIGPFARLRPETQLADGVKIGNFVEIKKSTIAADSKVNHLSYVGDTTMGSQVNVGAGTITCNYDGANKHQTIIGDNVFIGSDTQLVAPVTIASGATIGAGSTITHDTPANTLTLSRVKQATINGWSRPTKKK
ncbi:MAG: bifunctional UDP-N-acetylglucosamine diphosphorylase/glucosamine-1-phosphate N-acetyltransferase GlmU [Gammaproteobacteria bacterium]|nr:bifunctional UDP-N-acetylglucosamine diphosphorylase/glucosamine-1-phosphate N-acetyltransferase GlmU [Gammaproteobacteria bacterium]